MEKIPQAVLDLAKKEGYSVCTLKDKKYQGCDVYELHYRVRLYLGYPAIALYKDGKVTFVTGLESKKIVESF